MLFTLASVALAQTPSIDGLPDHMLHHFASATNAVWYIALEDLDGARGAARELDHDPPQMPAAWSDGVVRMREAARALAGAKDLGQAATLTVDLAAACAACHAATGMGPTIGIEDIVIPEVGRPGRHSMAAYFLWVGLVAPSDIAFTSGATALLPEPVSGNTDPAADHAYTDLAGRVATATGGDRGPIWAELLTACSECHRRANVSLDP